jgi:hypothetical protein
MLPREEIKDQKLASNTIENQIINHFFPKRLSDRDVKVVFIDTRTAET